MKCAAFMPALLAAGLIGCYQVRLDPIAPVATERLAFAAKVVVPPATAGMTYDVHSMMAGGANKWTLEVGAAVVQYADAYLANAFQPSDDVTIRVDLTSFTVHDFEAHADMRFTVTRGDKPVAEKTYQCKGEGYAARVIWGGAFAMKSSMRKTTDEALRDCFGRFLADAKGEHTTWVAAAADPTMPSAADPPR
jgi:hypothetical protein